MRKLVKIIIELLFFCSITGCSNKGWLNTNIKGNVLQNKPSVKDDFYQAINYEYCINAKENKEYIGGGYNEIIKIITENLSQLNEEYNTDLLTEKNNFIALYRMTIDWKSRDLNGIKPIIPVMGN